MFEKLVIKHFQKHKFLEIEFDPQITTLVGPTDIGKSAVIRALELICLNRVDDKSFVRHGRKYATGILYVDGKRIIRKKGRMENCYQLGDQLLNFDSVQRKGVPPAVKNLLNVGPNNFQSQHDPPFWFSLTPGQVSKELNKIVDLEIIDSTLSEIAAKVRRTRTVVEVTEQRLEKAQKQTEELQWIVKAHKALQAIETQEKELAAKRATVASMVLLINKAVQHHTNLSNAKERMLAAQNLVKLAKRWLDLQRLHDYLKTAARNATEIELAIYHLRVRKQNALDKIKELSQGLCPICGQALDERNLSV